MENRESIIKFEIDDKTFYVKFLWKPTASVLFHIKIYDGDESWSGEFTYDAAQEYIERFDEPEDDYYSNVKNSLLKENDSRYSFEVESDNTAKFIWQQVEEDATFEYGSVSVQRDNVMRSKDLLIDDLIAENAALKASMDKLNSRNKDLSVDLDKCKKSLEECKDMKTSLETSLYGKFVQLLTAKKRRISLLEENLSKISKSNRGDEMD